MFNPKKRRAHLGLGSTKKKKNIMKIGIDQEDEEYGKDLGSTKKKKLTW